MTYKTYRIYAARTMAEKKPLCKELLENLRQIDKQEIEGLGISSKKGVEVSIYETSPVFYARSVEDNKLLMCWGLQILINKEHGNTYLIWALGTNELKRKKKSFIKESKQIIKRWIEIYGELTNTVAVFNRDSIRWLKWLGADFSEPFMINETEYVNFYLRKKG